MDDDLGDIVKPIVVSVVTISNIIANSLVIAVHAINPEMHQDHSALFMISLCLSDLGAGFTWMPIGAAVCSGVTPNVRLIDNVLPDVQMFFMWCLSFNSLHSLTWFTVSKMITLLDPLHPDALLTRNRCHAIIVFNWIVGAAIASTKLGSGAAFSTTSCTYFLEKNARISVLFLAGYAIAIITPGVVLVYATARIFVIVVRTQRDIFMQVNALDSGSGGAALVTLHAINSAKVVLIICLVSVLLALPMLATAVLRHATEFNRLEQTIGFSSVWIFSSNTFMNSFLYIVLYRSVRKKTKIMIIRLYKFVVRGHD